MAITLDYVTASELDFVMSAERQAEATDDSSGPNDTPTADTDKIDQALKFAESTAESYLIGYELPIAPVPFSLKYAILNIAKYYLLVRDGRASEDEIGRYDEAIEWLRAVNQGEARLPDVDEDPEEFVGNVDTDTMTFEDLPWTDYDYFYNTF